MSNPRMDLAPVGVVETGRLELKASVRLVATELKGNDKGIASTDSSIANGSDKGCCTSSEGWDAIWSTWVARRLHKEIARGNIITKPSKRVNRSSACWHNTRQTPSQPRCGKQPSLHWWVAGLPSSRMLLCMPMRHPCCAYRQMGQSKGTGPFPHLGNCSPNRTTRPPPVDFRGGEGAIWLWTLQWLFCGLCTSGDWPV